VSEYTDEDRAIGWEVIRQLGEPADPAQRSYERLIATAAASHARAVYAERITALEGSLRAILGVPPASPAKQRRLTDD
jgi:hypothetical protein